VQNVALFRARRTGLRRWAPLLAVTAALSLSAGCMHHGGGGHPGSPGTTMPAHAVDFTLTEGHIALDGTVASGRNQVHVTNSGNFEHEIIFVKAESAASLPTKADGSMDESKLPRGSVLGEIELDAGQSATRTFSFTPGNWVAVCNVVSDGHVHFASGMFLDFTVA
jgi:hypothetical protein